MPLLNASSTSRRILIWLALLLLTAGIYGRSVRYGFVHYDDDQLFSARVVPSTFFGPEGRHLWTSSVFGNWQPIVTLTAVADRQLHGLNPHWMHAENALLHALCGIAVFEFLRRASGRVDLSIVVAAWFVCAPMHVESVAWLSERKDVMAALFFFLSLAAYADYAIRRSKIAYAMSIAFAGLSLMCKPMAVTLPAVMLLMDVWPLRRWVAEPHAGPADIHPRLPVLRVLLEKVPIAMLAAGSAAIAVFTQSAWGHATAHAAALPMSARIDNAIVCYVLYLWKLIVPMNLAVFYPHPGARPVIQVLSSAAVLLVISAWVVRERHRRPYLLVGWLWFLGTLVPVIGLMQIGGQAMADRYSYIPSVGLFIMIVRGLDDLLARAGSRVSRPIAATAIIAINSALATNQVGYWFDTETLFSHALDVTGDNYEAYAALGDVAYERHDLPAAAGYYTEVIRIAPGSPKGYERLAQCVQDPQQAAVLLRQAVARAPQNLNDRLRLARALVQSGDIAGALDESRIALRIDPTDEEAKSAVADLSSRPAR